MYEKEIEKHKWTIVKDLEVSSIDLWSIEKRDAEAHLNIMKIGRDNVNPEIVIDCGFKEYITKFSKSEFFTLESILVSTKIVDDEFGRYILSIRGSMPIKAITIRAKKTSKKVIESSQKRMFMMHEKNIIKPQKKGHTISD